MYNYKSCPVCEQAGFSHFITAEDHTVSHEKFNIVSCDSCGFKFTNPRPNDADLGKYYQSEDYISHSDTRKGIVSKLYHQVRKFTLKKKLELVSGFVSRGAILDYGCGTGAFVNACGLAGWNAFGVEPDRGARKMAFESGLNVSETKEILDQKTKDLKFNAITLWHVLEHVTDLTLSIDFFKRKLAREGVLIIAVPNHKSFDAQHYGEFWAGYDVPRHLYHFDPASITQLMQRHSFKLLDSFPMKFDSFYVSLLSEKYKTQKTRLFQAFATGLKSNLKTKAPGDYSSVIYVFAAA